MKARDTERVGVVRYLLSKIHEKEIDLRSQKVEFKDKHARKVILKQIKQREESIEAYKEGGREDLVEKESKELEILKEILDMFPDEEN
jgi:uncharacterized protein YqeY